MENLYTRRSEEILDYTIENRRFFHTFAETGMDLPKTKEYITKKLTEIGLKPYAVGKGIACLIGKKQGKTILLRADMDALPMTEESGEAFACTTGACHSCGHDAHMAMLLSAAKMLYEREEHLNGTVKLMFQPGEEVLTGACDMIENGILENPKVDAAIASHTSVAIDTSNVGQIAYSLGAATLSCVYMKIDVEGCAAHGSTPEAGVDAITIASHIVINLQEVLAREISCFSNAVLLVGTIKGGTTSNTVAGEASLGVSYRSNANETDTFIEKRIAEIAESTANMFRGKAKTEKLFGVPPIVTDVSFANEMAKAAKDVTENVIEIPPKCFGEDFSYISNLVPSAFFHVGMGGKQDGFEYSLHHPKMRIDEQGLITGSAVYAHCAEKYLK